MLTAVLAALAAAALFAIGTATQHRSVGSDTRDVRGVRELIRRLLRDRRWWAGLLASLLAFVLHAVALGFGDLALVQPVVVSGIVFAVVFRAALDRRLPSRRVIGWCLLTWLGLATLIAVLRPGQPRQPALDRGLWFLGAGVSAVLLLILLSKRMATGESRGLALGAAAGLLYGLTAGMLKLVMVPVRAGRWPLAYWPSWALLAVGVGAVAVNQAALRATRLSVSTPVVNIVNVVSAMAFGVVVFGERLFGSPSRLVVELVALAAVVVGVQRLADRDRRPVPDQRSGAERSAR